MDATNKTLSGLLVALLVVSGLAPAAVALHGPAPNPTSGAGTAIVDAVLTHSETVNGTSRTINDQTTVAFNTRYDLTVTNLSAAVSATFRLFREGSGTAFGNPASASADLEHVGRTNVTFTDVTFEAVGVWYANETGGSGASVAFVVSPQPNLQVSLSQPTFAYSTSPVSYTITVTNLSAGQTGNAVAGASLVGAGIPQPTTTNSAGTYTFFGPLPEAGNHLITATRDYNGDGLPELQGNVTLIVSPATLTVTGTNTVNSGFADTASWNITYPNGTNVFSTTPTNTAAWWRYVNLSVTGPFPNGSTLYTNISNDPLGFCQSGFAASVGSNMRLTNSTATCIVPAGNDVPQLDFASNGRMTFRPGTTWLAGEYRFSLIVNSAGGSGSSAEYSTTWTQSTTPPAAVNLKVFEGSTQITSDAGLRVRQADLDPSGGTSLGSYALTLSIIGASATEFPTTLAWDAFTASNITVSGDVLSGTGFNTVSIAGIGSTGQATISNVVPTRVNGNVNFNVNWKNQTTVLTLPIKQGADSTVDRPEIVVDQTSTLSVTVQDVFGNRVPTATVVVTTPTGGLYPGAQSVTVNGTGAPGLGQNGVYTLNVRPTETGDMVLYTTIGSNVGGVNNQNFSYLKVRVAPAHDLAVTLGTNSSMAGNNTYVYLNATTSEGIAVTTANNYRVYFINQTVLTELRTNGTTALAGLGNVAPNFQTLSGAGTGIQSVMSANTLSGAHLNVSLDPGTWWVYVCSNMTGTDCTTAKHDNINNTPSFVSHPWRSVFTPDRIASNAQLQSNVPVTVKVTDMNGVAAPSGTQVRVRTSGTTGAVTPAVGTLSLNSTGEATFTATGVTIGDLVFETDVSGSPTHWTALDTPFKVVGPNVQVSPDRIPLGRPATLIITVKSLNGTALPNLQVQVCGTPLGGTDAAPGCTGNVTTDASGLATVGVNPLFTGNMTLRVSGVNTATNVTVFAGLDIIFSRPTPAENETQEITVSVIGQPGGVAGVAVNVSRDGQAVSGFPQTTGSSGVVVVPNLRPGNYTVTASRTGFETATKTFTVSAAAQTPTAAPMFSLANLQVPASATVGQAITVNADVRNNGTASGTATVLLLVNGAVRDSRQVPVAMGSTETVAFDFTPNTAGAFNVTVRLSGGETLGARTVTVTTPTGTTPATTPGTTPATTTPAGTTPATSTPAGTTPATTTPATTTPSPEVPGFEVVALFAALGVALLVLRRRS